MRNQTEKSYGIGVSPCTGIIYVGLTQMGKSDLAAKQDMTWEVCKAVSHHLMLQEQQRFVFQKDGKQYEMLVREVSSD